MNWRCHIKSKRAALHHAISKHLPTVIIAAAAAAAAIEMEWLNYSILMWKNIGENNVVVVVVGVFFCVCGSTHWPCSVSSESELIVITIKFCLENKRKYGDTHWHAYVSMDFGYVVASIGHNANSVE